MYPSFLGNYYNDNIYHSKSPQENYHPSPIYFPLEDEAVFCEFFQQQFFANDHSQNNTSSQTHDMNTNVEECSNNIGQVDVNTHLELENSSQRKRPSKRDRHSKINTARGPRDRRMRLSLDVAKKLFGLQDLLGFDKASKTVDWLLTKSKTAILELLRDRSSSFMGVSNSASSTSECEILSGTVSSDHETTKNKAKSCSESSKKQGEKITRGVRRCANFHHPLAKASRERARERARERTTKKRNNNHGGGQDPRFRPSLDQAMDQINQLVSWCPFEETRSQNICQVDQMSSNFHIKQGFGDANSSRFIMANWNQSNMFNYQHTSGNT